jgi:hypothetical protein
MNLNIILIGSGNYVLGDENKYGTIFPALLEFHKNKGIGSISILCNSFSSLKKAKRKVEKILQFIQTKPNIFYEINKDEKNIKKILLQRNINTAIVSVPDPFHYYYSKILLKNKINILVVKPLTNKIKESLELIKISKKKINKCNCLFGCVLCSLLYFRLLGHLVLFFSIRLCRSFGI